MDDGFLLQPSSDWRRVNNDVKEFSEIDCYHFIACLGEPGIGKSNEFTSQIAAIKSKSQETDIVLVVDLERCRDSSFVQSAIIGSDEFAQWLAGTGRLYMFFENLDRMLLQDRLFAEDLARSLQPCPLDRLFIRVACRTFDWSSQLEYRMIALFSQLEQDSSVGVFELAPLTRQDVEIAAIAEEISVDKFMADLQKADVVPLAIKPVTLRFLLNKYKSDSKLPATQMQLYHDGCLLLCSEPNEELLEQRKPKFTPQQRMAAAMRIAAVMMFSQKSAIWDGIDDGTISPQDVKLDKFVGGKESFEGLEIEVSKELVEETLSSGLFTSRGTHRFAFGHQTYEEFLAAYYLIERKTTLRQILSLLVHPTDPKCRIVPQLTGVAAWIATMDKGVLSYMINSDPEALLLSDLDRVGSENREYLVDALLRLAEQKNIPLRGLGQRYAKLNHNGLAEQLRKVITDKANSIATRYEAVQIAKACKCADLAPDLSFLALNTAEEIYLRCAAVNCIEVYDDTTIAQQLIPLAISEQHEDTQDELKGAAFRAVFPKDISAEQLFASISKPKDQSLFGQYAHFLEYEFFDRASISDLAIALKWVLAYDAKEQTDSMIMSRTETFCDKIMWHAWQQLEASAILNEFAFVALERRLKYDEIIGGIHCNEFAKELASNEERRRVLLERLISVGGSRNEEPDKIAFSLRNVAVFNDLPWLLGRLDSESDQLTREIIIRLAELMYVLDRIDHFDSLWEAKSKHSDLSERFSWLFEITELDSATAERLRTQYYNNHQPLQQERKLLDPPAKERINTRLEQIEGGHSQQWDDLTRQLGFSKDSYQGSAPINQFNPDIRECPGWLESDDSTKSRIVAGAKSFITDIRIDPKIDECLTSNRITNYLLAGVKALLLLKHEDKDRYAHLTEAEWQKWLGAIILYPCQSPDEKTLRNALAKDAYARTPDFFIRTIVQRLKHEDQTLGHLPTTALLKDLLDTQLIDELLKLADTNLCPQSFDTLLLTLLIAQVEAARQWILNRIKSRHRQPSDEAKHVIAMACLLECWTDAAWDDCWTVIETDTEFGKKVFAKLAAAYYFKPFLQDLSDEKLVKIFVWLQHNFPPNNTPRESMVWQPTGDDQVAELGTTIVNMLANRHTTASCDALQQILSNFPKLVGVRRMLDDSIHELRTRSWSPYQPKYILGLASNRKARLVSSEAELLEIIVDALGDLQVDLQGHTPRNRELWSAVSEHFIYKFLNLVVPKERRREKQYLPEDEAYFCDFVAGYLRDKLEAKNGIIINREVVVRSNPGGKGERTDIHVDAIAPSQDGAAFERLTVIIEAKGLWNQDLESSMKTQLVGEYLRESRSKSGIYLVGYFNCAQWSKKDYRRSDAHKYSLEGVRQLLNDQAKLLSQNGFNIRAVVLDASLRDVSQTTTEEREP
jgi:hypothetical protein